MREVSTVFTRDTSVDTRKVGVNLACGVHAFESITTGDILNAFSETGISPFDKNFPQCFRPRDSFATVLAETKLRGENFG